MERSVEDAKAVKVEDPESVHGSFQHYFGMLECFKNEIKDFKKNNKPVEPKGRRLESIRKAANDWWEEDGHVEEGGNTIGVYHNGEWDQMVMEAYHHALKIVEEEEEGERLDKMVFGPK